MQKAKHQLADAISEETLTPLYNVKFCSSQTQLTICVTYHDQLYMYVVKTQTISLHHTNWEQKQTTFGNMHT